jgi:hypothetical protein
MCTEQWLAVLVTIRVYPQTGLVGLNVEAGQSS